jgi:hypothetical protein
MKVSGFTFIRNAIKYDYPIIEAIKSILPACDELVVAVGNSEDDTHGLIQSIGSDKIRIIETVWDDSIRMGGKTFAMEASKAFEAVSKDADWCFYIQGDEVLHEQYLPVVRAAMLENLQRKDVDGLLFRYLHFYGSYDYVGESTMWYRKEIRIIKNKRNIFAYKGAQGFRKDDNKKLNVKLIPATMYHYGWVLTPEAVKKRIISFNKFYRSDDWIASRTVVDEPFEYSTDKRLVHFEGTHPLVMQTRISQTNWTFAYDVTKATLPLKERIRLGIEKLTGWLPFEYRNYKIIH